MKKIPSAALFLLLCSFGGGLIYQSAIDIVSVGADSTSAVASSSWVSMFIFALGVVLIASGIITAIFVFSSIPGAKRR